MLTFAYACMRYYVVLQLYYYVAVEYVDSITHCSCCELPIWIYSHKSTGNGLHLLFYQSYITTNSCVEMRTFTCHKTLRVSRQIDNVVKDACVHLIQRIGTRRLEGVAMRVCLCDVIFFYVSRWTQLDEAKSSSCLKLLLNKRPLMS